MTTRFDDPGAGSACVHLLRTLAVGVSIAALAGCATGSSIIDGSGGATDGSAGPGQTSTGSKTTSSTMSSTMQTSGPGGVTSSSTGTPCSESPCKLTAPQCGCPASRMCTIDGTGARVCVPSGTQGIGQACSATNDCSEGGICLGQTIGSCFEFCTNDGDCTGPGGLCLLKLNDGVGGTVPNVTMCSQNCNPASATSCNVTGLGCQIATDTATNKTFTSCVAAGAGGDTAPCPNGTADCKSSFGCFTVGASDQCLQWCKVASGGCPSGLSCLSLNPALLISTTEYGVCN